MTGNTDKSEDKSIPRNKILVAFNKSENLNKEGILHACFNETIDEKGTGQNILKNLNWKTKYYSLNFDLYIDEFEDVKKWLDELQKDEYKDLRDVLAGILIVDKLQWDLSKDNGLIDALKRFQSERWFKIWCNTEENIDPNNTDEVNSQLTEQNLHFEVIDWNSPHDSNEFGEKLGTARLREIIDTNEWENCELAIPTKTVSKQKNQDSEDNSELDVEFIIGKLQQARLRYNNQEFDDQDALEFAEEIAEEILKYV